MTPGSRRSVLVRETCVSRTPRRSTFRSMRSSARPRFSPSWPSSGAPGGLRSVQLSHSQYDELERAVDQGRRIVVIRRGTEYVVLPLGLRVVEGRELIEARNP